MTPMPTALACRSGSLFMMSTNDGTAPANTGTMAGSAPLFHMNDGPTLAGAEDEVADPGETQHVRPSLHPRQAQTWPCARVPGTHCTGFARPLSARASPADNHDPAGPKGSGGPGSAQLPDRSHPVQPAVRRSSELGRLPSSEGSHSCRRLLAPLVPPTLPPWPGTNCGRQDAIVYAILGVAYS